jgi:hypothetical protein
MDILVKPSALTDYLLLSQRFSVVTSDIGPIVLPASPVFNQVVSTLSLLYIIRAANPHPGL